MTKHELEHANIGNLTDLWRQMGTSSSPLTTHLCLHQSNHWPHRIWLDWGAHEATTCERYLSRALELATPYSIVPLWKEESLLSEEQLEALGWKVRFTQVAMCLDLRTFVSQKGERLAFQRLAYDDVELWAEIASLSFGYNVDSAVVRLLIDIPELFLLTAYLNGTPVATGMLWRSHGVAGIHQVGVLPECRRRGFAREIMQYLLAKAKEWGLPYATLQASESGRGLYQQLGFHEQFVLRNVYPYVLL